MSFEKARARSDLNVPPFLSYSLNICARVVSHYRLPQPNLLMHAYPKSAAETVMMYVHPVHASDLLYQSASSVMSDPIVRFNRQFVLPILSNCSTTTLKG